MVILLPPINGPACLLLEMDTLLVTANGPQAAQALDALQALARDGFGDGISDQAGSAPAQRGAPSPPSQQVRPARRATTDVAAPTPGSVLTGIGASAGIALGPARRLHGAELTEPPAARASRSPSHERERLQAAIADAQGAIEQNREDVAARAGRAEAEIFDAHLTLLSDTAMLDPAERAIVADNGRARLV